MKAFLVACLFVLFGLSPAQALSLNLGFTKIVIDSSELEVYVDNANSMPANEVLSQPGRYFTKGSKNSYPYSTAAVWTRVRLTNGSDRPLRFHLINNFGAHDQVDVYLLRVGGLSGPHLFGDTRPVAEDEVINRYVNVHVELAAGEALEVVSRYHSTSPVKIKMILLDEQGYVSYAVKDLAIWGIFIGVILALAIYNLVMFASLKNVAFLYYVLNCLTNLYNTLTSSGHIYAWLSPWLPLSLLNLSYNKIAPSLGVIFMSLFIISFFEMKKKSLWLYRLLQANAAIIAILLISLPFFYFSESLLVYSLMCSVLLPLSLLVMLVSALVIAWKRLFGGIYFLFGAGAFLAATICYILYFVGLVDFSSSIVYALPLSRAAEAILFAMALGKKIKTIEAERLENALLVEESNKFNSTSSLLAGILHQFKQPLVSLGTELLNLRTERFKKGTADIKTDHSLGHMETQVAEMNGLVGNFYSFYAQDAGVDEFSLAGAVAKVRDLLEPSLKAYGISFQVTCGDRRIRSREKALTQIMLIVLENAVEVLAERKVRQPTIWLDCLSTDQVVLRIYDNGGGFKAGNIEKVFNIHYSHKQTRGLGIGLSLAKKLAETRLNGSLTACNEQSGACFVLNFKPIC